MNVAGRVGLDLNVDGGRTEVGSSVMLTVVRCRWCRSRARPAIHVADH